MLIINDVGDSIVNTDNLAAIALQRTPKGNAIVAFGLGVQSVLTVGSDERLERCMTAVAKAHKENWKILDLRDLLGQRSDLAIAAPSIVLPNGQRSV